MLNKKSKKVLDILIGLFYTGLIKAKASLIFSKALSLFNQKKY